jgi:hypothetical protein
MSFAGPGGGQVARVRVYFSRADLRGVWSDEPAGASLLFFVRVAIGGGLP